MADMSITAANVVAGSDADILAPTLAGETIAAGKAVTKLSTTKKWMLSDSNSATAELRTPGGFALNSAALNQPLVVQKSGDLTIGGTLTAGVAYYLSDTPGGICPVADIGTGEYSCLLGIAKTASVLDINIQPSGVAL